MSRPRFFTLAEKTRLTPKKDFTALGSVVFLRRDLQVSIYSFRAQEFHSLSQVEQCGSGAERFSHYAQHEKFRGSMNPTDGRKGYLRVRLSLLDLVNVHCVADVSNLDSMQQPSPYAVSRAESLRHVCQQTGVLEEGAPPALLFGDLNFRLDMMRLIEHVGREHCVVEKKAFRCREVHAMAASPLWSRQPS